MDDVLEGALMACIGLLAVTYFLEGEGAFSDMVGTIGDTFNNLINTDNTDNNGDAMRYLSNNYQNLFTNVGAASGVPGQLLSAVAFRESSYNPNAVSPVGAEGLMQLMPQYYPGVNRFDPTEAVPAAANSLASYKRSLGSWYDALAAYNWGIGYATKLKKNGYVVDAKGKTWYDYPSDVQSYANSILSRAGVA